MEDTAFKVGFVCPTYGPVNPIVAQSIRFTCIQAAQNGFHFVADASHDRVPTGVSRSGSVRDLIDQDINGLLWIDSDMKPEAWHATQLLTLAEAGFDFVTGLYFRRKWPHYPLLYKWDERKKGFTQIEKFPTGGLFSVDGCGFGFVYTSTSMLRTMTILKDFDPKVGWFPDRRDFGGFGEDLGFCDLARRAGFTPTVDSSIIVGHEMDAGFASIEHFKEAVDEGKR